MLAAAPVGLWSGTWPAATGSSERWLRWRCSSPGWSSRRLRRSFALEASDTADVGEDVGVLTVFIVAIVISAVVYFRSGAGERSSVPDTVLAASPAGP